MIRIVFIALLIALPLPAAALDPASVAQTVVREWQGWMERYEITEGSIILAYQGEIIAEHGINRSVDDPAKVASLSKSITAICALKAAKAAGVSVEAPLSQMLPHMLNLHEPEDPRLAEITIEQLITHRSGLDTDYHRAALQEVSDLGSENKAWQFSRIAQEQLSAQPGSAPYRYANANYLILGLVIEALAGESYEDYCRREVLERAGAGSATLNSEWRVMSAWGGWEISARDFLKFARANFTGRHTAERPAGFELEPALLHRNARYGAGMLFRRTRTGVTAWHQGSWSGVRGRLHDRFGAYVALYDNGFMVVTNYAHDAWHGSISRELDEILYFATHP